MSETQRIETPAATDLPSFKVFSDETALPETYQIMSVSVERAVNRVSTACLLIKDGTPASQDFPITNSETLIPGKPIRIQAGYHQNEELIFEGIVVKIGIRSSQKKTTLLEVVCKDEAIKLTVGRKNHYYYDATDSDILEELIGRGGLTAEVEATEATHAAMVQFHATDWDFLVTRAEANGKLVYTEDGTIRVAAPDLSLDPEASLAYGGNIKDFEAEIDARFQYGGVHAFAWDAANQELLELEAESPPGTLPGNLDPASLAEVIGLESYDLRHGGLIKDAELQAQANAHLLKSHLSKVRARVRIQGLGKLKPGQMIELSGVGDRFAGPLFIAGLQHTINTKNWETQLELGLSLDWFLCQNEDATAQAASHLLPAINGLQVGLVTALESDPEGEYRVQVRIPMINPQEEGIWARVATLDAGENRGTFFLPEIGDEVVLGFFNDDPRNPVVLGMLHSSAKAAPVIATDDNHEKGIITRGEMKFLFNDEHISCTIETPKGNKIVLSEEDGGISIIDENDHKILLASDGITLDSAGDITIKAAGDVNIEGTNINQSAQANFKAEGSAGAEVSSGATAVLKGAMVQIN